MTEIKFSDAYNDLSQRSGVNAGFQLEFFRERCNGTWRTDFIPFRNGQASGWLGKAGGILGGTLGTLIKEKRDGLICSTIRLLFPSV